MYVTIHTITIVESDWVLQAQFLQTTAINSGNGNPKNIITKRVLVRAYPIKYGNKSKSILQKPLVSRLRTILKRKNTNIRHHFRTIKIVSQNRSDFIQKIDDCATGIGDTGTTNLPRCPSNSNQLLQENQDDDIINLQAQSIGLNCDFTVQQTSQWLSYNRFGTYLQTFAGFSGADMLRMTKDDLMQICGQADGIRLFNSLHSKSITPKLTLYLRRENASIFHAIYLMSHNYLELVQKLSALIGIPREHLKHIYYQGPHGIHVLMNDDVIKHFKEESMFLIEMINDSNSYAIILKPIIK